MVVDDRVSDGVVRPSRQAHPRPDAARQPARELRRGSQPGLREPSQGLPDVDGNEYIDWINCVSAVILGHADAVVDGAVKEQIEACTASTARRRSSAFETASLIDPWCWNWTLSRQRRGEAPRCH